VNSYYLLDITLLQAVNNRKMSDFNDADNSSDVMRDTDEMEHVESEVNDDLSMEDPELDTIRARIKEMEEESEKIRKMQCEVEKQMNVSVSSNGGVLISPEEKMEIDARSVYVGNVDYGTTAEELEAHFHGCGSLNRVTIQCDKFTGHPKGFAYIEFADKESVQTALALDDSLFRGRQIKISMKRTNKPGISSTNRPPRGRGMRGRIVIKYVYPGARRGRGAFPARRRGFYSPY